MQVETEPREPQLKCLRGQNTDARVYTQVQLTDANVRISAAEATSNARVCGPPTEGHGENPLAS
jgi:hypothetical protein